jgi:hypothetical protein
VNKFLEQLQGGDLRSVGGANEVSKKIKSQDDFDQLFETLFSTDRKVVMRAADAIEKVTAKTPEFLKSHKKNILKLSQSAEHIELKWHLAQLLPRLRLTESEFSYVWKILRSWVMNEKESRIVRVNSLQSLYDLTQKDQTLRREFEKVMATVEREDIPSLNARIRKIMKGTPRNFA